MLQKRLREKLGEESWFTDKPRFEKHLEFSSVQRNIIEVSQKGMILVPLADGKIKKSADGGGTWNTVKIDYNVSGYPVVNEQTGEFLILRSADFDTPVDPKDPCKGYKLKFLISDDEGKTWRQNEGLLHLDDNGWLPSIGNDKGITLQYGDRAGRLLMPARVLVGYANKGEGRKFFDKHYNTAVYSDDGGCTWHPSAPFPEAGTGEGTLVEFSDGRIYYNSRSHIAEDAMRRIAWSYDGGETWEDLSVSKLPDRSGGHDGGNQAY